MDIKQLQAMGGMARRAIVRREIPIKRPPLKPESEWLDPAIPEADESAPQKDWTDDTLTVFIRKRSAVDFFELVQSEDRQKPFVVILRCICNEDGSQVFQTFEQVEELSEFLWMPMAKAANEVNQYGAKNSQPRTSYGTSSRSSSAARSRKLRKESAKKNSKAGSRTAPSAAP